MASYNVLAAFLLTTFIFAFIPGPAMFYAAAQTLAGGRRPGLMAVLGIHVGCYLHIAATATGLTVLFQAIPPLYLFVKLAGAVYLIWLGISLFRRGSAQDTEVSRVKTRTGRRAFVQSITVEALNPKTAIFFLAFLPQFVDASAAFPLWLQIAILGVVTNAVFSLADVFCVILAGFVVKRLKDSSRTQRYVQRAGGTVLIGLGAHLALQRT